MDEAGTRCVEVTQPAPDFTLEDETGSKVTLRDLLGRPVFLMFYPFDWSGLCTEELCTLRDSYLEWTATGALVFGSSRDSKYLHKAWKEHLGLGYSLLADPMGDVAKQYGAWNENAHRADRMTIVLDSEGIIRYVMHNDSGTRRDQKKILDVGRRMAA